MRPNPDKSETTTVTVKVAPWKGINILCDDRIARIHDRAGVPITMKADYEEILISAKLSRERLKELLEEEGIKVLY